MPARTEAEPLVEHLRERLGDELLAVVYYERGGYDVVYVRDDLTDEYTEPTIEKRIEEIGFETHERGLIERSYDHGELRSTVKSFDEAIECYLFVGPHSCIAVSLTPTAFHDLRSTLDRWRDMAGLDAG